jgi:hypothetical protein
MNSLFKNNAGKIDRIIRIIVGVLLVGNAFTGLQTPVGWIGLTLIMTGVFGVRLASATLDTGVEERRIYGVNVRPSYTLWAALRRHAANWRWRHAQATAIKHVPIQETFLSLFCSEERKLYLVAAF